VSPSRWPHVLLCVGMLASLACTKRYPLPPPPQAGAPGGEVLKAGDVLDVRFYRTPELNVELPIRGDGKISLEPVGDVQAAGLAPDELARTLTERYATELTDPRVTVIVRSHGGQVFVGGEVGTPSVIPLTSGMTALQAIHGAGGFMDKAARNRASCSFATKAAAARGIGSLWTKW
jgi:polysaccharide biosynthesis/export protein